jgi:hypothetical protein
MRLRCSLYHRNIRCFAFLPAGPYNPTEGRLIVEAQAWCWRTGGSDHGRRFAEHGGGAAGLRLGPLPHPRRACAAALVAGHFEERARLLEVSVARRRGSRGRAGRHALAGGGAGVCGRTAPQGAATRSAVWCVPAAGRAPRRRHARASTHSQQRRAVWHVPPRLQTRRRTPYSTGRLVYS